MNPFAPEFVLFFVSLLAGLVMMLVNALGGSHDGDSDHDVAGHDSDHDSDSDHHEHEGVLGRAMSALGVGRAPLMLVLMLFFSAFGAVGMITSLAVGWLWLSVVVALFTSVVITRAASGWLGRVMPRTESYNVSAEDLIGCRGVAVYGVSEDSGSAQVRDESGDVFKIQARTTGETIAMNQDLVVVGLNPVTGHYIVTSSKGE